MGTPKKLPLILGNPPKYAWTRTDTALRRQGGTTSSAVCLGFRVLKFSSTSGFPHIAYDPTPIPNLQETAQRLQVRKRAQSLLHQKNRLVVCLFVCARARAGVCVCVCVCVCRSRGMGSKPISGGIQLSELSSHSVVQD